MELPEYRNESAEVRHEPEEPRKIQAVKAPEKKAPEKKESNPFVEDLKGAAGYVYNNTIKPLVKDILFNTISNFIGSFLWKDDYRGSRRDRDRGYRDYAGSYSSRSDRRSDERRESRGKYVGDYLVDSEGDARYIIDELRKSIRRNGFATAYEFFDMLGQDRDWSTQGWGWRDLYDARPVRSGDRWIIDLPEMVKLK